MEICVTQEDICAGRRLNSEACAVAKAVNRTLGCKTASVTSTYVRINGHIYTPVTPVAKAALAWFVRDFDRGVPVQPFSFEL